MGMESTTMLLIGIAVVILAVGQLLWITKASRRDKQPEPICGCGHHHAYHNPDTKVCNRQIRHQTDWDYRGLATRYKYVTCDCQTYSGPQVIDGSTYPQLTMHQTIIDK